jgi:hypothetical protein
MTYILAFLENAAQGKRPLLYTNKYYQYTRNDAKIPNPMFLI